MDNKNFLIKNKEKEKIFIKIIEEIKHKLNPKKIIIFGSIANGTAKKDSDIDIAVDTDLPLSLLDYIGNFDIVNLKKIDKKLKEQILKRGIVYYEKS